MPIFLPFTEPKKEYYFIWNLEVPDESKDNFSSESNDNKIVNQLNKLKNKSSSERLPYISQLAQKVDLPDDKLDLDMIPLGIISYPVPKTIDLGAINVTYLEDSSNTVYNFHRDWFYKIRNGDSMSMNALKKFCLRGVYYDIDKTLTSTEYLALTGAQPSIMGDNSSNTDFSTGANIVKKLKSEFSNLYGETVDPYSHILSKETYPFIFPISINRGSMDKSGENVKYISVTYARVPNIVGYKPMEYLITSSKANENGTVTYYPSWGDKTEGTESWYDHTEVEIQQKTRDETLKSLSKTYKLENGNVTRIPVDEYWASGSKVSSSDLITSYQYDLTSECFDANGKLKADLNLNELRNNDTGYDIYSKIVGENSYYQLEGEHKFDDKNHETPNVLASLTGWNMTNQDYLNLNNFDAWNKTDNSFTVDGMLNSYNAKYGSNGAQKLWDKFDFANATDKMKKSNLYTALDNIINPPSPH